MRCVDDFAPPVSSPHGQVPALIIEGLSLAFGTRRVFDDFHLQLDGGRITCLLGPSGCGKSTLLRLIAGVGPPLDAGTIRLHPPAEKIGVAWMGQNDLLLPWLSLEENVLLGARLRGELTAGLQHQALDLLRSAGLLEHCRDLPARLSGGMRQRGALLRTLMEGAPVVLMDEPFSALDALTRRKLQDLAAKMVQGKTVLLVTHDPLEALRLADRVIVLSGRPARVAANLTPPGKAPRQIAHPDLARQHEELLGLLLAGDGE